MHPQKLLETLRMVKVFFDIGLYDKVCGRMESIDDRDYNELILIGLEKIAPSYRYFQTILDSNDNVVEVDRLNLDLDYFMDCLNENYAYSSPEMKEYYGLCRRYSKKHSIPFETSRYFLLAALDLDRHCALLDSWANIRFDNPDAPSELIVEWPITDFGPTPELFQCIHNIFEFYEDNIEQLKLELASG